MKNKGGVGGGERKRGRREASLKKERPSHMWVCSTLDEREGETVNVRLIVFS